MTAPFRSALLRLLLGVASFSFVHAAEEPAPSSARERMRARIAEDARKIAPAKRPTTAPTTKAGAPAPTAAGAGPASGTSRAEQTGATPSAAPETSAATARRRAPDRKDAPPQETPTVLPQVEVKKARITVLDQQLAEQDRDIAREKKNLQVSEVDNAFNDAKVSRPLAIFGGESTQFRRGVASERIELMEAEKDLMEAIARARTKEEKAELQKQLTDLKAMRRDLERSMR